MYYKTLVEALLKDRMNQLVNARKKQKYVEPNLFD